MENLFWRGNRRMLRILAGLLAVGQTAPAHAAPHREGAASRRPHPNFRRGKARAGAWQNLNVHHPLRLARNSRRSRPRTSARSTKALGLAFVPLDELLATLRIQPPFLENGWLGQTMAQ